MKLLDTAVAVDHLRGAEPAVELLTRLSDEDELLVASELVRFELLAVTGMRAEGECLPASAGVRPDEMEALEGFCLALIWLPVDRDITRTAGAMARKFRGSHSGIDDVDYLIAATAVVFDAELLTTNVRHFPMIEGLGAPY